MWFSEMGQPMEMLVWRGSSQEQNFRAGRDLMDHLVQLLYSREVK